MRYLLPAFLWWWLSACVGADSLTNPTPERDDDWAVGSLAAAGFDTAAMGELGQQLDAGVFPNVHKVLVEYDGKLVFEKCLAGEDQSWGANLGHREFDPESLHDLRSISKSVTALLLGIALGENFEAALERPVIDYFPELADKTRAGFEKITLHQVLTMTDGLEWNEMDVPYSDPANDEISMYYKSDPIEYVLAKKPIAEPGERWYYNGGTTMLIADIVVKLSGKPLLEYARDVLFEPLGIEARDVEWKGVGIWWKRPQFPAASSGLRLRARDLAKIGSLMLHDGRWQGRQVVPAGWVRVSAMRHTEQTHARWSMGGVYGYGYQWWHGNFETGGGRFSAVTGVGYGGQRLFVIPKRKIVITVFAGNYSSGKWRVSEQVLLAIMHAAPQADTASLRRLGLGL